MSTWPAPGARPVYAPLPHGLLNPKNTDAFNRTVGVLQMCRLEAIFELMPWLDGKPNTWPFRIHVMPIPDSPNPPKKEDLK